MSNRLSGDCSIPKFFVPYLTPADMRERLPELNPAMARQVDAVLNKNRAERHIRGGQATKEMYQNRNRRKN